LIVRDISLVEKFASWPKTRMIPPVGNKTI
jgi:hypothetical protein